MCKVLGKVTDTETLPPALQKSLNNAISEIKGVH